MTTLLAPMCYSCVHLGSATDKLTCAAFPEGIPLAILEGQADHRYPVEGDNGIVFEQKADSPEPAFDSYPFAASEPAIVTSLRHRVHGTG